MKQGSEKRRRRAIGEAGQPVTIVWLSALVGYCAQPEATARRILNAASQSRRGVRCASCGHVVKKSNLDADLPYTIWTFDVDGDSCCVLTCSALCSQRVQCRGINFGVFDV